MINNQEELFQMLDWNNSKEIQNNGIELGIDVKDISIFIMPTYGFNVWHNCAEILYRKNDEQLQPYLLELFRWLEDMNWPGALLITKRLSMYKNKKEFEAVRRKCLELAKKENNPNWGMSLKTYRNYL